MTTLRFLAVSLDEAERVAAQAGNGSGSGGRGQKRVRRDDRWWPVLHGGAGVSDTMLATITQRISALNAASTPGGLPPVALEEAVKCLVKVARLGIISDEASSKLLWSLRPREDVLQSTITILLSSVSTGTFPSTLRTQVLRWLLLMLNEDVFGTHVQEFMQESGTSSKAGGVQEQGAGFRRDSLANMFVILLRPLYRVLFHMLIASSITPSSQPRSAPASPANRSLLCEILLKASASPALHFCFF